MREYNDIEAQFKFATGKIDSQRRVEISLRDLIFVYKTVARADCVCIYGKTRRVSTASGSERLSD
jgi:hypothetical protein